VICNRALAGQRVRLTGYAKAESLVSNAFARLYCHTPTGIVQDVSTTPVGGTTDWIKVSVEMDVPKDTYAIWAWLAYSMPAPGAAYFDDMSVEVVGPAGQKPRASGGKSAGGKSIDGNP
jgi:hypothetical protein